MIIFNDRFWGSENLNVIKIEDSGSYRYLEII